MRKVRVPRPRRVGQSSHRAGPLVCVVAAALLIFSIPVSASAIDPGSAVVARNDVTHPNRSVPSDPPVVPPIDPPVCPFAEPTVFPPVDPLAEPTVFPPVDPLAEPTVFPPVDPPIDPLADPPVVPPIDPPADPPADPLADPPIDPLADPPVCPPIDPPIDPAPVPDPAPIDPSATPSVDPPVTVPIDPPPATPTDLPPVPPTETPAEPVTPVLPAASVPPTTNAEPNGGPIPLRPRPVSAQSAATVAGMRASAAAERTLALRRASLTNAATAQRASVAAKQRASFARAAAYAAAQRRYDVAKDGYTAAKGDYAAAKVEQETTSTRATLMHRLATRATSTAETSRIGLASLVREIALHQPGTATAGVFLDARPDGNLLYQLAALDRLSHLQGNLDVVRARFEDDNRRAEALREQDADARKTADAVPLAAKRTAMEAAEATLDTAAAAVSTLEASAPADTGDLAPALSGLANAASGRLSEQGWANPAVGGINDHFGPRPERPLPGVGAFHYGTDIGAGCGAAVYAATSGIVVAAGSLGNYGNWILIDHGEGIETGYAHVATGETFVKIGERVFAGQVIAGVGRTGAATGCHLHMEVRVDGIRVDPQAFLAQRGIDVGR